EARVLHRDVKPENVRITPEGRVVLLDFGLARLLDDPGLTRRGAFHGTLHWAAPEQVRGETEQIGPATDVWGLGATLFWALCGAPPFAGDDPKAVVREILLAPMPKLTRLRPDAPRELGHVLERALAKEPEDRYPTAMELHDDLQAVLE